MTVHLLWHVRGGDEANAELLGVYTSRERALDGKKRASQRTGFRDHPDASVIDEDDLEEDYRTDGFVSVF
jgi:hypothetical protein